MPSGLDTAEHVEDIGGHGLPSVHPRSWRPWAPFLRQSHATRSPRTLRSRAMPCPQTRETLMELVARQDPFLYIQAGSGL